jgi:penicillin amidase
VSTPLAALQRAARGTRAGSGRKRWTIEGEREIRIERDGHGVPHIQASSEADALRGLGHCHARDRGLQLVLTRILSQGRAAEVFSGDDEMVAIDRFFRRVGLERGAAEQVEELSERHRALLEAYTEGVNEELSKRRPWELALLRHRPERWELADSIVAGRLIGYVGLAQSQGEMELLAVQLTQAGVSRTLLDELFGDRLEGLDERLLDGVKIGNPLVPEAVRWNPAIPTAAASNNWAVSPSRSATGAALLANDPHLEVNRLPALWYEALLETPDRWSAGATMPGVPGVVIGRNDDVGWGVTYAYADTMDSWVEECRDGACLRRTGEEERWERPRVREETILRRGKEPLRVTFHENEHGTLAGDPAIPGRCLATRWAGAETGGASLAAALDLLHAGDAATAGDLLSRFEYAFNWVIADRRGTIGYRMSGLVPKRREGANGFVPLPGWDARNDWQGFHAPEDLPQLFDPPEGFLATANDDLNHLGRVRPINLSGPPYRAQRIRDLLATRSDWTVEGLGRIQMDQVSGQALRFLKVLRPLIENDPRFAQVLSWDGSYAEGAPAAAWFDAFHELAVANLLSSLGGPELARFITGETALPANFSYLFDDVLLDIDSKCFGHEGRDVVLHRHAETALTALAEPRGVKRTMVMRHLMLGGRVPSWLGFDHGPVPLLGRAGTVHQGQLLRAGGRDTSIGPAYRMVTDLGADSLHTAIPGGPSDRRFSRWYTSGVADWVAGRLKTLAPSRGE